MIPTFLHERKDGKLIEYRRQSHPVVLLIEGRVLKHNGMPYDNNWFPISDSELLSLQHADTGILDMLDPRG